MKTLKVTAKALLTSIVLWLTYGVFIALFFIDPEKMTKLSDWLQNFNTFSAGSAVLLFISIGVGVVIFIVLSISGVSIYYIWKWLLK